MFRRIEYADGKLGLIYLTEIYANLRVARKNLSLNNLELKIA